MEQVDIGQRVKFEGNKKQRKLGYGAHISHIGQSDGVREKKLPPDPTDISLGQKERLINPL